MQHPVTLLEAKGIAEELELTQSMVKAHQKQKKTIKAAQHSGTQERRSGRLYQSVQRAQMKTCRNQRQRQTDSFREEAAYPLIEEHVRLAVRMVMDRQLCGDPC